MDHQKNVESLQTLYRELGQVVDAYTKAPGPLEQGAVVAKTREMTRTLGNPYELALVHTIQEMELVSIRTIMSLGVLNHMPPEGSISLDKLSTATGAQKSLLERLLRMAVCTGFLEQNDDLTYQHTAFSKIYQNSRAGSLFQAGYDECFLPLTRLQEYLNEKGWHEPTSHAYCPYSWSHKQEGKNFWEIMAQNPEGLKAFQAGLGGYDNGVPSTGVYDFSQLDTEGSRPILVDIGGGHGQVIKDILKYHPGLPASKFILQDLKEPLDFADMPSDVVKMEHDFWTEQPVKGAKAYFLRRVIHDYSDEKCAELLKHLAAAAEPDSRILIAEMILAEKSTAADLTGAAIDLIVMSLGGKERTEAGYRSILKDAGLELVKIWTRPQDNGAIIEAKIPQ